jgi:hypothetical protein
MESSFAGFIGNTMHLLIIVGRKAFKLLVRIIITIYEGGSSSVLRSAFCAAGVIFSPSGII